MTIPILIKRKYGTDDATMLTFADVTLLNFTEHLAAFTAFDANLNNDYVSEFTDAISQARNLETDDQIVDAVAQNTMDVEAKMVVCRDAYLQLKYFVELAFADKPGRWNEFGFNDYNRIRSDHDKMVQFMTNLFTSAQKYDTELTAAGYLPIRITQLGTYRDQLQALVAGQELSKGERSHSTNERIKALNDVYAKITRICTVGKLQFANDYGLYQLFLLPWGSSGSSNEQMIEDTITGLEIKNVPIPGLLLTTELTISNLGDFDLHFYFATTNDADTGNAATIIGPGFTEIVTAGTIGLDGTHPFLNVKMPTGTACDYRVEWV